MIPASEIERLVAGPHQAATEQLISRVAESSCAAFMADGDHGILQAVSRPAAALLRTTPERMVGRSFVDFAPDTMKVAAAAQPLVDGTIESYQATRRLRRVDGSCLEGRLWVRLARHSEGQSFVIVHSDLSPWSSSSGTLGFSTPVRELATVPGITDLSAREREVVDHIAAGRRVPQIANRMQLAPTTVRNHLAAVYRKLGVHTQAELVALLQEEPVDLLSRG